MKKTPALIFKISVTLILLVFLFRKIDFDLFYAALRGAERQKIAQAFLLFLGLNLLIVLRWHILLKGLRLKVGLCRIFLSYIRSLFFNLFLPSTIGGDTIRTLDMAGHTHSRSSAILATVILDRLAGFVGLLTVLIVSLGFGFRTFADRGIFFAALIIAAVVLFIGGIMFSTPFFKVIFNLLPSKKIKDYLGQCHEAAISYKRRPAILAAAWLTAVVVQAGAPLVYWFSAQAIGINLQPIVFFILVPVITCLSAIPVSIGGLGVREAASIFVFSKVGLAAEEALSLSLINFGFLLALGITGGMSYAALLRR